VVEGVAREQGASRIQKKTLKFRHLPDFVQTTGGCLNVLFMPSQAGMIFLTTNKGQFSR
jgi:cbb3-type cytochrome oxidase subunit 1